MKSAPNSVDADRSEAGINIHSAQSASEAAVSTDPRLLQLRRYIAIARPHHYGKNILVVAGSALAFIHQPETLTSHSLLILCWGLCATCLIASSNYVLNEILDAGCDRHHVAKRDRPMAAGYIPLRLAFLEWFALGALGQWIASTINSRFFAVAVVFQVMAIAYNVRPLRLKDIPYLDVLCESVNSPLRLLMGWMIVLPSQPLATDTVLIFWMAGACEMARKRLKEIRFFKDKAIATAYRRSFNHYSEARLLASVVVYGALTIISCTMCGCRVLLDCEFKRPEVTPVHGRANVHRRVADAQTIYSHLQVAD